MEYQALALAQLAAFPDLTFYVDDLIRQQKEDGWHVAINWTMLGTHAGPSVYGNPSGKRVRIAGISQYLIQNQQIVAERTEWNEFRLMQKIMERPPNGYLN
jgi:predicted ester cyclase